MRFSTITKAMKAAELNRVECYNKAFAARTNAERLTLAAEAHKWSNEWVRLSRLQLGMAV